MNSYTKYHKEYYEKNKDKLIKNMKEKYNKNELLKIKTIVRTKEWLSNNPITRIYFSSKQRAKKKGIEFTITKEDIVIPELCPILGILLKTKTGFGRQSEGISLDRIDPTKGYIPGNVWVISDLANRMKSNATKEQLLSFATGIIKLYA